MRVKNLLALPNVSRSACTLVTAATSRSTDGSVLPAPCKLFPDIPQGMNGTRDAIRSPSDDGFGLNYRHFSGLKSSALFRKFGVGPTAVRGCHCEKCNDEAIPIVRSWESASFRSQ
jgi:hypothetical protein